MGARRRARECALQILFGLDWTEAAVDEAIGLYWVRFAGERPTAYEEVHLRSSQIVRGVVAHRAVIDAALAECSHNWKLDRMSVVDRNLLRVAAFEMLHSKPQPPRNVVLNEAVEIAKKFGNVDSAAFVNGVLHQLAEAHNVPVGDGKKKRKRRPSGTHEPR